MRFLRFNRVFSDSKTFKNIVIKPHCVQFSSEHRGAKISKIAKIGFKAKPDISKIDKDYIGPADKLSNLRPILRHIPRDETPIDRQLRLKQIEVEQWNQQFWEKHNKKFIMKKEAFIKANKEGGENDTLSADKMSEFYKRFLDENWQSHFNYNRDWYKKNFELLILACRTKFQIGRMFQRRTTSQTR